MPEIVATTINLRDRFRPTRLPVNLRVWLLVPFCLLLVSCSSTTFFYNRLDFILPWYLERYVDLDREQAKQFDAALEPLLEWHRYQELPAYVSLLVEMQAELEQPLSLDVIEDYTQRMELAWYRLRDRILDELLLLGAGLSDEQIEEFLESLEKKQRKYEDKYLDRSDETFREEAYDDFQDGVEDYLGRLDAGQRDRLRMAVAELWRSDDRWLQERADWIALMREQLRRAPGWQQRLRSTIVNWEAQLDRQSMAVYDHNTRVVQEAVIDVINSRSERQDTRLRRKLSDLAEDLELLAQQ